MQPHRSYHSLSFHESGRSPTREEYLSAIAYAQSFPYPKKRAFRCLLANSEMKDRIWDWYSKTGNTVLDFEGFKHTIDHLLVYYYSPPKDDTPVNVQDDITLEDVLTMSQADGDRFGDLSESKIWAIVKEHAPTIYMFNAYVTAYLKSTHHMLGQTMIGRVARYPSSFNQSFPELGPVVPVMIAQHHTSPECVTTQLNQWGTISVNGSDVIHPGETLDQHTYLFENQQLTRVHRVSELRPSLHSLDDEGLNVRQTAHNQQSWYRSDP